MTHYKPGCISCDIVTDKVTEPGGTLYENENWHISNFIGAAVWPGFLIVKLKRHCEHIAELTTEESASLGPTLQLATQVVMQELDPAKVYVCSFGDGVKHIHFWILPRPHTMRSGMHSVIFNLDWRLFLTRRLKVKRWLMEENEIIALADKFRDAFQTLDEVNG